MKKKMVAPIIITVLMVLYYILYFGLLLIALEDMIILSILLGIIPISCAAVIIGVCIQRIKEIRSGEEDDLSQY